MKKIILTLSLLLFAFPLVALGDGGAQSCGIDSFGNMMSSWGGMMGMGGGGYWGLTGGLISLVWLIAGVLLIIFLWQQITKK